MKASNVFAFVSVLIFGSVVVRLLLSIYYDNSKGNSHDNSAKNYKITLESYPELLNTLKHCGIVVYSRKAKALLRNVQVKKRKAEKGYTKLLSTRIKSANLASGIATRCDWIIDKQGVLFVCKARPKFVYVDNYGLSRFWRVIPFVPSKLILLVGKTIDVLIYC